MEIGVWGAEQDVRRPSLRRLLYRVCPGVLGIAARPFDDADLLTSWFCADDHDVRCGFGAGRLAPDQGETNEDAQQVGRR